MEQDAAYLIEVEVSEFIAVVSINIPAKRNALSVPARARMLAQPALKISMRNVNVQRDS